MFVSLHVYVLIDCDFQEVSLSSGCLTSASEGGPSTGHVCETSRSGNEAQGIWRGSGVGDNQSIKG